MFNSPNYLPLDMREEEEVEVLADAQHFMTESLGFDDHEINSCMKEFKEFSAR